MKKRLFGFCRALVTLVLIGVLLKTLPLSEVAESLRGVRVLPGIALLFISAILIAISTWKWLFILRRLGIQESWVRLYGVYLIAYFYGNFLPSTVGGDVYRVAVVGKDRRSQSFAAIFLERGSGLFFMVLLCSLSPLFLPGVAREPALLVLVALSMAGCVGLGGCLASARLLSLGTLLLRTFRMRGLAVGLENSVTAIRNLAKDPGSLLGIAGLTLVFNLFSILNVQMAFLTLGETVELPGLIGSVFLVMLISAIPVSINGLGLSEGAFVYCLGLAGVAPATAVSVALLLRAKSILTGMVGGLVSFSNVVPEARMSRSEPEVSPHGEALKS